MQDVTQYQRSFALVAFQLCKEDYLLRRDWPLHWNSVNYLDLGNGAAHIIEKHELSPCWGIRVSI